jgi:hypothetical protein
MTTRTAPLVTLSLVLLGLAGCDDIPILGSLHTAAPCKKGQPNPVLCTCTAADIADPTFTDCCQRPGGGCPMTPAKEGGMPAPACLMAAERPQLIAGLQVSWARGLGKVAACAPFQVTWTYRNHANTKLPAASAVGAKAQLTIEQVPPVPPQEVITLPAAVDASWKALEPCEVETKTVTFMGLEPKGDGKHGFFRAHLRGLPGPQLDVTSEFDIGGPQGGDACPPK